MQSKNEEMIGNLKKVILSIENSDAVVDTIWVEGALNKTVVESLQHVIETLEKQKPAKLQSVTGEIVGTPKTLDEAVVHAICIGPINQVLDRGYLVMKDFMAQKFQLAIMRAEGMKATNSTTVELLNELFVQLTKRSS